MLLRVPNTQHTPGLARATGREKLDLGIDGHFVPVGAR
jgi:hypothetical protein